MARKYWGLFPKRQIGKGEEEYQRGLTNLRESCGYPEEFEWLGAVARERFTKLHEMLKEWCEV